jgi:hypothetical protein
MPVLLEGSGLDDLQVELAPGCYRLRLYLISALSQEKLNGLQAELKKRSFPLLRSVEETVEVPSKLDIVFGGDSLNLRPVAEAVKAANFGEILGWVLSRLS